MPENYRLVKRIDDKEIQVDSGSFEKVNECMNQIEKDYFVTRKIVKYFIYGNCETHKGPILTEDNF